ncbi:MAG: hypothetical protein IJS68_02875 [Clostridia bacterium]|nr:hypothetical protein [Clostridia bacterium]
MTVKLVFRIIGLVILVVGLLMVVFAKQLVPEHKYKGEALRRRKLRIQLIGYILCAVSLLVFIIVSWF